MSSPGCSLAAFRLQRLDRTPQALLMLPYQSHPVSDPIGGPAKNYTPEGSE